MTRRQTEIITTLSIIVFILALMVSSRLWFRLDLTKNKAYTISKVSRNLHAEIPDYVNITYYLSNKLKTDYPEPGEIEDTLREYAAYSKGKIRVTVRDPIKSNLSAIVEELGIQPRQVRSADQDQTSLTTVYSGIVIEYLDKTEVFPWIMSSDTLEYDLTSRIRAMVKNTERRIGVITGDSFRQWRNDFGYLDQTFASAGYRVRQIQPGDEIPDNLPALFVLGGVEELDDWALYRIDRYIQTGGKVFFAVKGVYVDTVNGTIEARYHENSGLLDMIASYGVTVRPEIVLDRNALTLQYQTRLPSGAIQWRIVRYPMWIGVLADNANSEHPVSSRFTGLDLYWASPLELHSQSGVEAVELFSSTDQAWTMREQFYTSPESAGYLFEKDAAQTRGKKIFGAALSGVFSSFFGGIKPVREGSEEELPDMPPFASPSRIIVIGDVDFATGILQSTQAGYNLDFLLRAADWLASDDDIIGIRNRQSQAGRLDKIMDSRDKALAVRFTKILNIGLVPFFVIAAGLFLAYKRRRRSAGTSSAGTSSHNAEAGEKEGADAI